MSALDKWWTESAAASFDRQNLLAEVIGEFRWHFDMTKGTLTLSEQKKFFAKKYELPIQILGTESEVTNTWLWAWANEQSGIPENLLRAANQLREMGEREGVEEFTDGYIETDAINGHQIGMMASAMLDAGGYYRCPYEGGAMFVLLPKELPFMKPVELPVLRITVSFPEMISAIELDDYRAAFRAYLAYYKLVVKEEADGITGTTSDGSWVKATFDELGRMHKLELHMEPKSK